jgi:membrane protease YdiL (CAAX protease family)
MMHEFSRLLFQGSYEVRNHRKLTLVFQLFALGLLTHAIFIIIRMILSNYRLIDTAASHPAAQEIKDAHSIAELAMIFLTTVLLAPLVEEFTFRSILKANKIKDYFGISAIITYFLLILSDIDSLIPLDSQLTIFLAFFILCMVIGTKFLMIFKNSKYQFSYIRKNHPALLLFITSLLFGIAHINVIGEQSHIVGYIAFILPLMVIGYIYAYARLRMGIAYAVLCHALNNLLMFILNLL